MDKVRAKRTKTYSYIKCFDCDALVRVRSDNKKPEKRCRKCASLKKWASPEYRDALIEKHKANRKLYRINNQKPEGESNFNSLFCAYRKSAQQRSIEFLLTKDFVRQITKQDCHYCGVAPAQVSDARPTYNGFWVHNGIDRVDNGLGYIESNVVACCKTCNYAKGTKTYEQFIGWISQLIAYHYEQDMRGSRQITAK